MLAPTPQRAGPLSPPRQLADRRRHSRLAPTRPSLCRLSVPGGPAAGAFVFNLSASGAALFAQAPFPVGGQVRLALVNNAAMYCLVLQMTVLRCQASAGGDWFVAGMFDRQLAPDELMPFLV